MTAPEDRGQQPFPEQIDVAVIGGGIVGLMAAWHLAEQGVAVAVFEKGTVGAEQSGLNLGYCRSISRDMAELPLIQRSLTLWRSLQQTIEETLGEDLGVRQPGMIAMARAPRKIAELEAWRTRAGERQHHVATLDAARTASRLPALAAQYPFALWADQEGWAEPTRAAPAIARALRGRGVPIIEQCAITALATQPSSPTDSRLVSGLSTARGTVRADRVLLAAGAWTSRFLAGHGVRLPQISVRGSLGRLAADAPTVTDVPIVTDAYYLRPMVGGGCAFGRAGAPVVPITWDTLRFLPDFRRHLWRNRTRIKPRVTRETLAMFRRPSPDTEPRTLRSAPPDHATLAKAHRAICADFPALADTPIVEEWAGTIDVTPDALPVIGPVPGLSGLTVATGFSGHGFGIGPAAGELAAAFVDGRAPFCDAAPFRVDRFS
ncbi:MAG: FAD-binding oxidoreductase [Pseudomonadota bacterium]